MRIPASIVMAAFLLILFPPSAASQALVGVFPGDQVKVWVAFSESPPIEGTFREVRNGSVVLSPRDRGEAMVVPLDQVRSVKSLVGSKRQTWKGLMIGAGVGATVGIITGAADGTDRVGCWIFCMTAEEKAALGGVLLGLTGGMAGLVVGTLIKVEEWREVPLANFQPRLGLNRKGGVEVGFSFSLAR